MLTRHTRPSFHTLDDAITLAVDDDTPDAIIYRETGQEPVYVSRRQFRAHVAGYASALYGLGIQSGDLVIIAHTQNLESIYAFWGAMRLGAIPAMFPTLTEKMDPTIYQRHMAELVRLSGVKAVLTTAEFAPHLRAALPCPVYGSTEIQARPMAPEEHLYPSIPHGYSPHANNIAFLQHSSGTTGLQKGVALSHTAVLNQIASMSDAIHLHKQDVIVSWLPLYHDMGLIAGFLLPLIQGIPLVLMSPFDWVSHPALLLQAIHDHQGTLCWLPNFAYNHCARRIRARDQAGLSLASMRLFINCSEPVRHDSHQLFLEKFTSNGVRPEMLGVSYAMAENTFAVTQTVPGQPARCDIVNEQELTTDGVATPVEKEHPQAGVKVSCGAAIAGTAVCVLAPDGRVLPDRHVGELAIRSNCMLTEYYKRPDLQPCQNGWYHTGDQGYMVDGNVFVIGRTSDLIINAGKNIYPQDIEAIVNTVPGVHAGRAVCFGVPDEKEGTELLAVVAEVNTEDPEVRQEINKTIRQEVTRHGAVAVSYVYLVGPRWLLKTSSGKIARAANRDKWLMETGKR